LRAGRSKVCAIQRFGSRAQAGVVPDTVTLSKALTGRTLPLVAAVASKRVYDAFLSDDDASRALLRRPLASPAPAVCVTGSRRRTR
jgi:adenosylmethionine-8-amino-7-oxononanoate aminotransferase